MKLSKKILAAFSATALLATASLFTSCGKDDEDDALEPEDAAFYEDSAEASEDADEAQDSYDYAASYSEAIDALHDEADEVLEDDDIPEVVED